jgi:hypothetical protein
VSSFRRHEGDVNEHVSGAQRAANAAGRDEQEFEEGIAQPAKKILLFANLLNITSAVRLSLIVNLN